MIKYSGYEKIFWFACFPQILFVFSIKIYQVDV